MEFNVDGERQLPTFGAPTWMAPSLMFLLILGFPILVIFAWAFEITPEGIKRTRQVSRDASITGLTGEKLNYIVTARYCLSNT